MHTLYSKQEHRAVAEHAVLRHDVLNATLIPHHDAQRPNLDNEPFDQLLLVSRMRWSRCEYEISFLFFFFNSVFGKRDLCRSEKAAFPSCNRRQDLPRHGVWGWLRAEARCKPPSWQRSWPAFGRVLTVSKLGWFCVGRRHPVTV